ncbi:hypothetical protein BKK54_04510 [Rodentibacter genomosp. 1]|uniref:DUF2726 domain-containing protein n=1 Tax=Rodentibacter genomosp. 1 TaxID=1908264 RepID=A0A1V3J7L9_9PAST|nr:DUF2726 domain-containing protein [Rodentibacter genomosp. 1]OOF51065.1 hypothetical protein BKK54_04510 [Rodentibacter genomosp. 1]
MLIMITVLRFIKIRDRKYKYPDSKNSLSLISSANFFTKPLMNRSEYKLFQQVNNLLNQRFKPYGFRLFSQVSMGEFLGCENDKHFSLINSKRVDFLIIDRQGKPLIVIEYQGRGHFQENAVERDAIKKEACRQAGVNYLDIPAHYDQIYIEIIANQLKKYLEIKNEKYN